jgi:hypothetical protein
MNKDELKKEAEELIQRFEIANSMNCYMQLTPDRKQIGEMLVMIAEPREKRIEELEKDKQYFSDSLDKQIEATLKLDKENAELKAQIEKMKNWCNCKNYSQCLIELAEQGKGMNPSECCVNCKKWEIKEK